MINFVKQYFIVKSLSNASAPGIWRLGAAPVGTDPGVPEYAARTPLRSDHADFRRPPLTIIERIEQSADALPGPTSGDGSLESGAAYIRSGVSIPNSVSATSSCRSTTADRARREARTAGSAIRIGQAP